MEVLIGCITTHVKVNWNTVWCCDCNIVLSCKQKYTLEKIFHKIYKNVFQNITQNKQKHIHVYLTLYVRETVKDKILLDLVLALLET